MIRPILYTKVGGKFPVSLASINHSAPSGPAAISPGTVLPGAGRANRLTPPSGVIRPMLGPPASQSAPSGPAAIPLPTTTPGGRAYSVMLCAVAVIGNDKGAATGKSTSASK